MSRSGWFGQFREAARPNAESLGPTRRIKKLGPSYFLQIHPTKRTLRPSLAMSLRSVQRWTTTRPPPSFSLPVSLCASLVFSLNRFALGSTGSRGEAPPRFAVGGRRPLQLRPVRDFSPPVPSSSPPLPTHHGLAIYPTGQSASSSEARSCSVYSPSTPDRGLESRRASGELRPTESSSPAARGSAVQGKTRARAPLPPLSILEPLALRPFLSPRRFSPPDPFRFPQFHPICSLRTRAKSSSS